MSTPLCGEALFIYLAASSHVVSAAIVREEHGIQKPVYYTNKTLNETESRSLPLEKLAFALLSVAKKLPHYFQAHTMTVFTEHLLKSLLRSADFSGCITKWGTQFGAYDIKYKPQTVIKGQILADFIVEFTPGGAKESGLNHTMIIQHTKKWKMFINDASNS